MVGVRRTVPKAFGRRVVDRRDYADGLIARLLAVVVDDFDEELAMLWRQYRRGGEA